MITEVCCQSLEDCVLSDSYGADRIELNSASYLGGLTPSPGLIDKCVDFTDADIIAKIRPRPAGFFYSDLEIETMIREIEILSKTKVSGFSFGILNKDLTISQRNKDLVDLAKSYNKTCTFHRAFDNTVNIEEALEKIIDLGFDRVLTSGGSDRASNGVENLKKLYDLAAGRIEIVAAGKVRADDIREIYEKTGINQFYTSCKGFRQDPTTIAGVDFSYIDSSDKYDLVDEKVLDDFFSVISGIEED
ncbi:MAG: copper homeostasis protein CutC [Finegoldia sp.]|nr:copper homeostasis protein CutC [Finegoldia sp.]